MMSCKCHARGQVLQDCTSRPPPVINVTGVWLGQLLLLPRREKLGVRHSSWRKPLFGFRFASLANVLNQLLQIGLFAGQADRRSGHFSSFVLQRNLVHFLFLSLSL